MAIASPFLSMERARRGTEGGSRLSGRRNPDGPSASSSRSRSSAWGRGKRARPWKESSWDYPQGTGGGNHLLWGGPRLEANPFFTRPGWLAAILRFWQHHPSLAYLFTGCYVGASSQAPRPDESARDLYDIDMAYTFLESLPPGDHRELINETLRHLQTDVTGNSHRSEMSFDKFWNTAWPAGALGLIEFRAIESLPRSSSARERNSPKPQALRHKTARRIFSA